MENNIKILAILLFFGILFSCNKKDDRIIDEPDREHLLTGHRWTLTGLQTEPAIPGVDPLTLLDPCFIDNIFEFMAANVLRVDEGDEKCEEDGPDVYTGQWHLNQDQTVLHITYTNFDQEFEIIDITNTTMRLRSNVTYQGFTALATFTFSVI